MSNIVSSYPLHILKSLRPVVPPQLSALKSSESHRSTTSAEARELGGLVERLADAPARSDTDRFGAACLCQGLPRGNGSREVFLKLAGTSEFWSRLDHTQRGLLGKTLAGAKSSVEAARLGKAYARILPDVLFEHAKPKGKQNALAQPLRAAQLVHDMSFRSHHLSGDASQMREVAWQYARSVWNTPKGQKHLATELLDKANEVLAHAFEDSPVVKFLTGRSQWIGERFTSFPSGKTWGSAAHKYWRQRITEDHCGMFNGDRSQCVK